MLQSLFCYWEVYITIQFAFPLKHYFNFLVLSSEPQLCSVEVSFVLLLTPSFPCNCSSCYTYCIIHSHTNFFTMLTKFLPGLSHSNPHRAATLSHVGAPRLLTHCSGAFFQVLTLIIAHQGES